LIKTKKVGECCDKFRTVVYFPLLFLRQFKKKRKKHLISESFNEIYAQSQMGDVYHT